ncbi:hypothetical protein BHF68_10500 [Desulfuribacillus alkaliarsenatis]|uniref:Chemotaxis protein CheA n=2 Tax=Desulfuribacillus alkaliarsenatis TaxID=766136 RepID=A0A1E5FZE4_9FIRM|nr:hypothetical protein BHF68_10500 [Desulfuribacillus alkaliarsenatis]
MFLEETAENIQVMEEGLLDLEVNRDDADTINVIFRAMHTIKGGAGLVGLNRVNEITHKVENLLDSVRHGQISLSDDVFKTLFLSVDILKKMIEETDFDGQQVASDIDSLFLMLAEFSDNGVDTAASDAVSMDVSKSTTVNLRTFKISLQFQTTILETGTDPLMLLRELQEVGTVVECYCNTSKLPQLDQLVSHSFYLEWTVFLETDRPKSDIDDIFIFVVDDNEILIEDITDSIGDTFDNNLKTGELLVDKGLITEREIENSLSKQKRIGDILAEDGKVLKKQVEKIVSKQEEAKSQESSSTIRVDTSKLESILNNLAELLISHSRVKELVISNMNWQGEKRNHTVNREILSAFDEVDKIIRVVQEKVMNTSMIPIGGTFTRFQRMMRDLAKEVGKEVKVHIEGKETELDKTVIEQIADPLKHLIRNALDHGLETPDEREARGKPRAGTIVLRAFHQEGNIVIQISDDGKGIDEQIIFAKAIEKGLVSEQEKLSQQEMYMLLFKPGFSTAKQITDISGRGVGLDVVMTNIKKLRGSVEMESEIGMGTTITIKLPLTLAIIDGMMVRVGQERFIIPLNMISEFYKATSEHMHKAEGKGLFMHLRGENMPYVSLADLLQLQGECHSPTDGILVILQNNNRKLAMMVDEILGQEQVVIKSLKENMQQQIDGIAGVTILGNGKVAIILDIPTIYKLVKEAKPIKSLA